MAGTWELNGVPTLIELDSIDSLNARCMSASLQSPMAMFNGNPNPSSVVPHRGVDYTYGGVLESVKFQEISSFRILLAIDHCHLKGS